MSNWTNITGRPDVQATMPEDFIANAIQQDLTANSLVLGSGVNRVPLARGQARFPYRRSCRRRTSSPVSRSTRW